MGELLNYLETHKATVVAFLGLIITATVKTAPVPGTPWNFATFYAWSYDATHQFFNMTNTRLSSALIPSPPANSAEAPKP